jgi:hypothetical protein
MPHYSHVSRFAAIAALLAVCPTGMAGGVQLLNKEDMKVVRWPMMGGAVRSIRQSFSRSNAGRTGGANKKRKAKLYARTRGRRLTRR